jgi:superfamily II DNA/RNA helicase
MIAAAAMNGDMVQAQREQMVERLKKGTLDILVATDVAARGLDVQRISHVINYHIPYDPESYVHRIGRTARADATGVALTLISDKDQYRFKQIEEFAKNQIDSYCSISKYIEENKQNFSELPEKEQAKARLLDDYYKNEAKPWDRFPQIKKAHKELKEALNKKLKELKQQVFAKYESIFDELDAKRKELGIDEQNIVTDRINYLEKLRKYKTITKFQIVLLEANDFRKDNLKKLFDHKAREEKEDDKEYVPSVEISIAHEMSPVTIETEEQLDAYLKKLKAKLMVKLKNHKKLFLS